MCKILKSEKITLPNARTITQLKNTHLSDFVMNSAVYVVIIARKYSQLQFIMNGTINQFLHF